MSIQTEITRLNTAKTNILTSIENKGVDTSSVSTLDDVPALIDSIENGGGTSSITKGLIINECDNDGYATSASLVGMTSVPDSMFYFAFYISSSRYSYLSKCTNFELPDNLTSIGTYSFYNASGLTITKLPDSITSIGDYGFGFSSNLALTKLPSSLTSLGAQCFNGCSKLAITKVPPGVTSIGDYTFQNCTSLRNVEIEGNITSIGSNAFYGCSNLSDIRLPNVTKVPTLSNKNAFTNSKITATTGHIWVPASLLSSFKSASNWSNYASHIVAIGDNGEPA